MSNTHPVAMRTFPTLKDLKAGFPGLKTLLFDMDGTLFDTEIYHTQAFQKIGQDFQIIPPIGMREVHALLMGKADHMVYEVVKEWPGFPAHWDVHTFVQEKTRHLLDILKQTNGAFFPQALRTLITDARNDGLNVALVTSSEKIVTLELLRIAQFENVFHFILTRDDSIRVKPDPWPYQAAMAHFRTSPNSTLIFEDSEVGLDAAQGSGAHRIKAEWY